MITTFHIAGLFDSKKQKKKDMTKLYIEDTVYAYRDREEMLSEIWAAKKKLIDGKWYVELSEVAEIIGS